MTTPNNTVAGHAPSVSPAYDRELIAEMLGDLIYDDGYGAKSRNEYTVEAISEQARLLREADNAEAANVGTVSVPPAVAGGAGELPVMRTAFVTSQSYGPDDAYQLVFNFRSLAAFQQAHHEWTAFADRRIATAEQPGSAVQGDAVAEVGPGWQLLYIGSGPIAEICRLHPELRIGSKLYTTPPPAPAAERGERSDALEYADEEAALEADTQPEARGVEGMRNALEEIATVAHSDQSESDLATVLAWLASIVDPLLAAAPSGVRVDEDAVTRALSAWVPGTEIDGIRWNVASFIESEQAPFTNTTRRDVIRAALTAALSANEVSRG